MIRLDTDKIHSFQAKVKAYYTKGVYYYLSGDFIESLKWFEKQIEAFEQNPQFNIEFQFEKARALANCALISLRINTETSFNRCFTGLNDFNAKTRRLSNQINYWCYVLKFSQIVKNGGYKEALDFSETAPLVNTLEVKFEAENVLVTERYLMLLGKIQAHMMLGENKNALRLINSFLNSPSAETKQDAYIFIRFLFLFIHQELGKTEYVHWKGI